MHLTFNQILTAQIGRPELKQVDVLKSSLGIDPNTSLELFKYDLVNPPANYVLYCDVIEPELVCLLVDLDYVAVV